MKVSFVIYCNYYHIYDILLLILLRLKFNMAVTLHTDLGDLKLELFCDKCPRTCEVCIISYRFCTVSLKADRTTAHDRTVRRPPLHAVNRPSCAVVLDRKQSTGVQSSGPRTRTQVLHVRDSMPMLTRSRHDTL